MKIETKEYKDGTVVTGPSPLPEMSPEEQLKCGISRAMWHDKAWEIYHINRFNDPTLQKVSIHTMRAVFDATYDALTYEPFTK